MTLFRKFFIIPDFNKQLSILRYNVYIKHIFLPNRFHTRLSLANGQNFKSYFNVIKTNK